MLFLFSQLSLLSSITTLSFHATSCNLATYFAFFLVSTRRFLMLRKALCGHERAIGHLFRCIEQRNSDIFCDLCTLKADMDNTK